MKFYLIVSVGPRSYYVDATGTLTKDRDEAILYADIEEADSDAYEWDGHGYTVTIENCHTGKPATTRDL